MQPLLIIIWTDFIDVTTSPSYIYGAEVIMAIGVGLCNQVRSLGLPLSLFYARVELT